jgi:hypothetical protein
VTDGADGAASVAVGVYVGVGRIVAVGVAGIGVAVYVTAGMPLVGTVVNNGVTCLSGPQANNARINATNKYNLEEGRISYSFIRK